jgi:hypothetical protein
LAADFPARRFNFGVAVVYDMLYAIGGHTYDPGRNGYVETAGANEQYTPIGYGNPEPTPTPTTTPEPTPEVTPFPTVSVFIIAVAAVVLVSAGSLVYFRKRLRGRNP